MNKFIHVNLCCLNIFVGANVNIGVHDNGIAHHVGTGLRRFLSE
jgi:hypothetical protein